MFSLVIDFKTVMFNALVCWALLSFLFDFYEDVKKVVPNPAIRTRLLCPKCFAFWLTLILTLHVFTALAVSFIVHVYYCKFQKTEL